MSTEEENKALVRRFNEIINQKELEAFYQIIAPECVFHLAVGDISAEEYRQFGEMLFRSIVPDFYITVEDIFAEEDKVVMRLTWSGTHSGELRGVAPTGNKIEMTEIAICKIANRQIVEIWAEQNELRLLEQLGAIPNPNVKRKVSS
jgi:steroid delta-isomerase-like uncharacterized protein